MARLVPLIVIVVVIGHCDPLSGQPAFSLLSFGAASRTDNATLVVVSIGRADVTAREGQGESP